MVLIDGTLIPTQRRTGRAGRRNYSGKHHSHGLHFLALTDERGRLLWLSAARPCSTQRQHRRPPRPHPGPPARRRPRGAGRPRLPRPGQRHSRPRDRHRLRRHPHPQAHPRGRRKPTVSSPSGVHRSSTASPTSRTGGS
ncbi:transposase family protein [Streptomyces hygroscopicus]|uniref:transposase family protein n=1 Tax=Streptomyces hygroscopicus TaxID=1912 RepID=UPI001F1CD455|nr:transposase family protein [Streptomyces hygroscopicus]